MAGGALPLPAAIVLGAAAGFTCGYLAFGTRGSADLSLLESPAGASGSGAASPVLVRPGLPAGRPAAAGATDPGTTGAAGAAPVPSPAPDPIVAPPGGFLSLAQALAAVPAVPDGPAAAPGSVGAGQISGSVTTEEGRPLEGVVVRAVRLDEEAEAEPPPQAAAPPPVPDLESHVRNAVTEWRRQQGDAREVATGPDGRFSLGGLANDPYLLTAWKEGYVLQPQGGNQQPEEQPIGWGGDHGLIVNDWAWAGRGPWGGPAPGPGSTRAEPGSTVHFLAVAAQSVSLSVVLPDGSPAGLARITVQGSAGNREEKWTPKSPPLRLGAGAYRLSARAGAEKPREVDPDEAEWRSPEVPVTVQPGIPTPTITLRLGPRPGIKGRISEPAGDWMQGVVIRALRVTPETPADPAHVKASQLQTWVTPSRPVFAFRDVPPGRYALAAARGWQGEPGPVVTVDVSDRMTRAEVALPPPEPPQRLTVLALAPDGRPVGDVQIWVAAGPNGQNGMVGVTERQRTPEGGHRLTLAPAPDPSGAGGGTPAQRSVTVASALYGSKTTGLIAGQTSVTVQFAEPASLEVTVTGYRGSGFEGELWVSVGAPQPAEEAPEQGFGAPFGGGGAWLAPDSEGRCHFNALEPGPREVVLLMQTPHGQSAVARVPLTLHSGANTATLPIPALYRLTVAVDGAAQGTYAMLRDAGSQPWSGGNWVVLDASGRAAFEKVAAGKYVVQVWGGSGDGGSMTISVPAESVVKFKPDAQDAMQVQVSDPEGALGAAGLETGDLVVAVDGAGFKSQAEFVARLTAALQKAEVTLSVLRGGAPREAKIAPSALVVGLAGGGKLGGSLTATSRK